MRDSEAAKACPRVPPFLSNLRPYANVRPEVDRDYENNAAVDSNVSGFLLTLTTLPASAHHSFAAEFDIDNPVTLKGVLTRMDWVNPHGWLYIDVTQPDGTVVNWAIEAGGPNQLLRRGPPENGFPDRPRDHGRGLRGQERRAEGQRARRHDGGRPEFLPGRRLIPEAGSDKPVGDMTRDGAGRRRPKKPRRVPASHYGSGWTSPSYHLKPRVCASSMCCRVPLVARVLP